MWRKQSEHRVEMAQGERHRRPTDTSGLHQTKQFKVFLVERRASIFYQVSSNCHACSQATTTTPMVIDLVCFDEKVETARNSPNFKSTLSLLRPQISFDQARGTPFNCFTTGSCKKNSFHDVSLSHTRVSVGKTSWHQRDLKGCLCISSYTFSSFDFSHYLCSLSRKFWLLTLLLCILYGKSLTIYTGSRYSFYLLYSWCFTLLLVLDYTNWHRRLW